MSENAEKIEQPIFNFRKTSRFMFEKEYLDVDANTTFSNPKVGQSL